MWQQFLFWKKLVIKKKNLRLASCQVKLRLDEQTEVIKIGTKKSMSWWHGTREKLDSDDGAMLYGYDLHESHLIFKFCRII